MHPVPGVRDVMARIGVISMMVGGAVGGVLGSSLGRADARTVAATGPVGGFNRVVVEAAARVGGGPVDHPVDRFRDLFVEAGRRHGVPPGMLAAVATVESGGRVDAVSRAGARGLMQLMPGTARALGVDPMVPAEAIDGAARYLRENYMRFRDWDLALAAYNAGPGAVRAHGGIPPYEETRRYVPAVMEAWRAVEARWRS